MVWVDTNDSLVHCLTDRIRRRAAACILRCQASEEDGAVRQPGEVCPNCGDHLIDLRHERQTAGSRVILLSWSICRQCHHVQLSAWEWDDSVGDRDCQTEDDG
jgi:ssDNA-binding Zn-finger/Zn-ribbon topoisomerase 1